MKKIGILMDFAGGYGRAVLRGAMHFAQIANDWEFVMPPMYALTRKRLVDPLDADGVIAMVHNERSIARYRRARVPIVNAARTISPSRLRQANLHSVVPDDQAVGRMAYHYFHDRGFENYAFCGHPTGDWSIARQHAFADAARADGRTCHCVVRADDVPVKWIAELPKPIALLAANDRYAWHAIDCCRIVGARVPDDVAILGVDNDEMIVELVRPALSSVALPGFRIGVEAATLLAALMSGQRVPPEPRLFPPESVISRASTDVLALDDKDLVDAIRFIRANAARPIAVADVLDVVPLSRRNLERRFRRMLGRSLHEEIRRAHIERAERLLRETALDMPVVARQSGFSSTVRFSTVFHSVVGMPPTAFRRAHRQQ